MFAPVRFVLWRARLPVWHLWFIASSELTKPSDIYWAAVRFWSERGNATWSSIIFHSPLSTVLFSVIIFYLRTTKHLYGQEWLSREPLSTLKWAVIICSSRKKHHPLLFHWNYEGGVHPDLYYYTRKTSPSHFRYTRERKTFQRALKTLYTGLSSSICGDYKNIYGPGEWPQLDASDNTQTTVSSEWILSVLPFSWRALGRAERRTKASTRISPENWLVWCCTSYKCWPLFVQLSKRGLSKHANFFLLRRKNNGRTPSSSLWSYYENWCDCLIFLTKSEDKPKRASISTDN